MNTEHESGLALQVRTADGKSGYVEDGQQKTWQPFNRLGVCVEIVILLMTFVFVLLFAAVVRVLGPDRGYKVLFGVIAFLVVWKTLR